MKDNEKKIDDLRWVRVFSPVHIPKYLVDQVKERDFTVEDFYKYQEINCLRDSEKGPTLNPFNHLYVLVDEENIVKGFMWFVIDPLSKDMIVHTFSIDNDYWGQPAMKKASDHIKYLMEKLKTKKTYWFSCYPKQLERCGFKKSKSILMEFKEEEENDKYD